jgi:hypothetical protein
MFGMTAGAFFASMMIGLVGMALFLYGKKQQRFPHLGVGVVLMAYTYFVPDVVPMVAIAVVLVGGLAVAVRKGL